MSQSRPSDGAVCIVLAAGFSQVEREIEQQEPLVEAEGQQGKLAGLPKALLPIAGKPMLDHWWEYLSRYRAVSEIFVVCNAIRYKQFERWATAKGLPVSRVVNTGATAPKNGRGGLRDASLGLRRAQQALGNIDGRDVIIFAGDTLFFKDFDLGRILDFRATKGGSLLLYYTKREETKPSERGMCDVDPKTSKILGFAEKPGRGQRGEDFAFVSPLFYILEPAVWQRIPDFMAARSKGGSPQQTPQPEAQATLHRALSKDAQFWLSSAHAPGHSELSGCSVGQFLEYAVETLHLPFWGMRMPGAFFLIGAQATYDDYRHLDSTFNRLPNMDPASRHIRTKTFARVGLMGNPSDGFHGKTIAMTIRNFWASAELWESEQLTLLPHQLYDPSSFSGLADLHFIGRREGYYGGTRLLMATCKRFQELCTSLGIALPHKNFTLKYDTNVPRQVGLAGSSAIVRSVFQALLEFYGLSSEHISMEKQPTFVLSVEQELGIQAGLQDRVVQVYQGLVFMDFDAGHMKEHGHGVYHRFPRESFEWISSLPFFLAYESDPSDSGKIHSDVRARYDRKEPEVLQAMAHFAELTVSAKEAIEARDHAALADLMDENFATRRGIYGDACLGAKNLQMIEICRAAGAAAKFPGSGGAVLGLCRPQNSQESSGSFVEQMEKVREALEAESFVFCILDPVMPDDS